MTKLVGRHPSFVAILRINGRNAALFYADRGFTQASLTKDQFDSFRHFFSQAEISIQEMANRR